MIHIEIDTDEEWDSRTNWAELAQNAIISALRHSNHKSLIEAETEIEISIKLTSNDEVQRLNAAYRGKDKPTNVLSFPMIDAEQIAGIARSDMGPILLGDIVLAHGICASEAATKDIATPTHASHLLVHGMLHLLGYDHEQGEKEAKAMEDIERMALAAIGIADPYTIKEAQSQTNARR